MAIDKDRKELPLTRRGIECATQQERLLYGATVEQLRKAKRLTQAQLEEMSGVTSRTIRNIESGAKAGQADKLIRLFIALEVDLDGEQRAEVEQYLAILAPLIRSIHPDHRLAAINALIPDLTEAVRRHPAPSKSEPASLDAHRASRVRGRRQDDLSSVPLDAEVLAASTDDTAIDPERGG